MMAKYLPLLLLLACGMPTQERPVLLAVAGPGANFTWDCPVRTDSLTLEPVYVCTYTSAASSNFWRWGLTGGTSVSAVDSLRFPHPGRWSVIHVVDTDTVEVGPLVPNDSVPPVAAFSWSCNGRDCRVFPHATDDRIDLALWLSWGDGTALVGPFNNVGSMGHRYKKRSRYTVRLTVRDGGTRTSDTPYGNTGIADSLVVVR